MKRNIPEYEGLEDISFSDFTKGFLFRLAIWSIHLCGLIRQNDVS